MPSSSYSYILELKIIDIQIINTTKNPYKVRNKLILNSNIRNNDFENYSILTKHTDAKYKKYHTDVKTCFALGIQNEILPENFIREIPGSTSQYWKHESSEKIYRRRIV